MSLAADIRARTVVKGPPCSIRIILGALPPEDSADLIDVLADPTVTASAIVEGLRLRNVEVQATTIQRHRRGLCKCGPAA